MSKQAYKILRADRANSPTPVEIGQIVYKGNYDYGLASDDTRSSGIEHISLCVTEKGYPTFTIPVEDVHKEREE